MRAKIRLDTMKDIHSFVNVVSNIPDKVTLEDDEGNRVSAKSVLGAIYTFEWANIYCCCERDIAGQILEWII